MRTDESNNTETHTAVLGLADPNTTLDLLIEQMAEGDDEPGWS
jgi:hypothetical protein